MSDQGSKNTHVKVEEAVLEHGRPFIGIKRPKGYRLGPVRDCYVNAGDLAQTPAPRARLAQRHPRELVGSRSRSAPRQQTRQSDPRSQL
jgi:hypothetical protein